MVSSHWCRKEEKERHADRIVDNGVEISAVSVCCKCRTSVIVLVVTYFLHGVGALSATLTTNGRDVTHKLTLSVKANLYGDYYKSLYIHTRGYIALGEEDVRRVDVNRFRKNQLIVPYYNEIYLKKTVQINTYKDNKRLQDFSNTVNTHFSQAETFRPKELLVVVWTVYTQFSKDSMQTITLTLGSDGVQSYILLNYERDRSNLYQDFLHFVYGISIAGFSAGDEVRFHEIFGNDANELFTLKLCKLSNMGVPGKWMFKLGGAGGVNKNFAVKSADRKLAEGNALDNNECSSGAAQCHKDAVCTNRNMGYICQCQRKFMGNGKICLKRDSGVYVRGYIDGQVNGNDIFRADHTILVNPKAGDVDVTVIPLAPELGDVFRVIPMLHGVIPWLFTQSDTDTYGKGFDLVGDRMIAKTLINFVGDPSELYITQKIKGIANGALSLITTINGNTPEFGRVKEIHIRNMTELFNENNDGSTSSISISHMEVNDKTYEIKTSRLIVYDPWMKKISGLKHELFMDFYPETFSTYSPRSGLYMKFQARIKNIKADNCLKKGCGSNAECVSTDDGSFNCECDDGYVMKEGKCVPKGKKIDCRSNPCGEYSKCVNIPSGFRCDCESGYKKDSNNKCTNVNECVTERACSNIKNAICVDRPGTYSCVCRPGFKTTDTGCEGPGK